MNTMKHDRNKQQRLKRNCNSFAVGIYFEQTGKISLSENPTRMKEPNPPTLLLNGCKKHMAQTANRQYLRKKIK